MAEISTPARTGSVPEPVTGVDARARLDLFKTLGDNTRYAIYLELARSPRPVTTAEVADALSLHPNTVRPHLERMRDVSLVDVDMDARGAVGRPQHRYSLSNDAPSLGLEPPVMPVLARMVLSMADRLGAAPEDAFAVGAREGSDRAEPHHRAPSALEALVADLDRLGFDPVVSGASPGDDDSAIVAFANCPFGDLAGEHPDLVCGLHHGMVAGFADRMGDAEISEFCTVVDRSPCQMTVRTAVPSSR